MDKATVNQILHDPLAQELLSSKILARLAYNGLDGFPRVVPIGFLWNGAQLVICTATKAPKVRALRARPQVALTIDTDTQPPHVLLVRGTARVELVEGVPAEYLAAAQKYYDAPTFEGFKVAVRALYKQMERITIEPEWAKLLDFETRMPVAVAGLVKAASGA